MPAWARLRDAHNAGNNDDNSATATMPAEATAIDTAPSTRNCASTEDASVLLPRASGNTGGKSGGDGCAYPSSLPGRQISQEVLSH